MENRTSCTPVFGGIMSQIIGAGVASGTIMRMGRHVRMREIGSKVEENEL